MSISFFLHDCMLSFDLTYSFLHGRIMSPDGCQVSQLVLCLLIQPPVQRNRNVFQPPCDETCLSKRRRRPRVRRRRGSGQMYAAAAGGRRKRITLQASSRSSHAHSPQLTAVLHSPVVAASKHSRDRVGDADVVTHAGLQICFSSSR